MHPIRRTMSLCAVAAGVFLACSGEVDPALYDNALKARKDNDWLSAVDLLKRFVREAENDPRVPGAMVIMGQGYEKMQQWDRAIAVYTSLQQAHAGSEAAVTAGKRLTTIRGVGEKLRLEGDFQSAARVFSTLVKIYPTDPKQGAWQVSMGFCSEMAGQWEQAIAAYENFLLRNPGGSHEKEIRDKLVWLKPFSLMMIDHFRGAADYRRAVHGLETFRKEHADHKKAPDALFWIAFACEYDQDYPDMAKAVATYRQFIKDYPDHRLVPQARYQVGHCLETDLDNPRPEEAVTQYDKVIRLHAGTEWAERSLFAKGHLCSMTLKRYEDAIAAYRAVVKPQYYDESRFQKFQGARFMMGKIYKNDLKLPDEAHTVFKGLLDEDPGGWFSGRCWWEMELIRREKEGRI